MVNEIEKIAKVKYCHDLIESGYLKGKALIEAKTHCYTYDKYIDKALNLNELELVEVNKIINEIKDKKSVNRVSLPKNVEKYLVTTYITEPFYTIMKNEAEERNLAISAILREHAYKNIIAEGKINLSDII